MSFRIDRRKHNRGAPTRKSYSKDVKRRSIALRDSGLSVDEIAKILDTAKSNVEKWCSIKVNQRFKLLCSSLYILFALTYLVGPRTYIG